MVNLSYLSLIVFAIALSGTQLSYADNHRTEVIETGVVLPSIPLPILPDSDGDGIPDHFDSYDFVDYNSKAVNSDEIKCYGGYLYGSEHYYFGGKTKTNDYWELNKYQATNILGITDKDDPNLIPTCVDYWRGDAEEMNLNLNWDAINKPDRDGDDIANDVDLCPDDPETRNHFEDEDGCGDLSPEPKCISGGSDGTHWGFNSIVGPWGTVNSWRMTIDQVHEFHGGILGLRANVPVCNSAEALAIENSLINPNDIDVVEEVLDSDNDGIPDNEDLCPDIHGIADLNGCIDVDGDGFISIVDCNDNDFDIKPRATEIPGNDIDEDCNGIIENTPIIDTDDVVVEGLKDMDNFLLCLLNPGSDRPIILNLNDVGNHVTTTLDKFETLQSQIGTIYDCENFADNDEDGLYNFQEHVLGTDPDIADSDRGGIDDGVEHHEHETNPLDEDDDITEDATVSHPTTDQPKKKKKSHGGCSGDCTPPTLGKLHDSSGKQFVSQGFSFNGNHADVTAYHTDYPLITTEVGKLNTIHVKIYENGGPQNIKWVQFGLGMENAGDPINSAEALILVEMDYGNINIKELQITDKNNILDSVSAQTALVSCNEFSPINDNCLLLSLNYVHSEAPIHNIVAVSPMDERRNAYNFYLNDGYDVLGESLNPNPTEEITASSGGTLYPIQRGLVEIVRVDKDNDIWQDEYGYEWQKNQYGFELISNITPDFKTWEEPTSHGFDRNNPYFNTYKQGIADDILSIYESYYRISSPNEENESTYFAHELAEPTGRDHPDFWKLLKYEEDRAILILGD